MTQFSNKVTIVTGGGSGIGKALVEQLIAFGAKVIFVDIDPERIKTLVESTGLPEERIKGVTCDVTDFDQVNNLVQETLRDYGRLDYIFNNAGIAVAGEVRDCTIGDWRKVLDVNLMGVVNGVAAAYPVMVSQGFGHIVNTGSVEGLIPFPGTVSYVASKFGVVGLSRALRIEGKDLGVKVSVVCPGYIPTKIFTDSKMVNIDRQKLLESLPEKAAITPEKCAAQILKGVKKNKRLIVITAAAKIAWLIQRFFPRLIEFLMEKTIDRSRTEIRMNN